MDREVIERVQGVDELNPKLAEGLPSKLGRAGHQLASVRKWYVTPPELMRWVASDVLERAIILLDFEPDVLPTGELRFDLQVAFKCLAVRQEGLLAHADFYIGCSSASVQFEVEGEQVNAFTPGMDIKIDHKEVHKRTRASKASLEPSLEFTASAYEGKLSSGGISLESGIESTFESSFFHSERYLAPVNFGRGVIWRLDPPSRAQIVRDFLFCNLHVYAECTDSAGTSRGRIKVRPSDLRFYGPDRRPYSKSKALMALYSLMKARKSMHLPRGIEVKFSEAAP